MGDSGSEKLSGLTLPCTLSSVSGLCHPQLKTVIYINHTKPSNLKILTLQNLLRAFLKICSTDLIDTAVHQTAKHFIMITFNNNHLYFLLASLKPQKNEIYCPFSLPESIWTSASGRPKVKVNRPFGNILLRAAIEPGVLKDQWKVIWDKRITSLSLKKNRTYLSTWGVCWMKIEGFAVGLRMWISEIFTLPRMFFPKHLQG